MTYKNPINKCIAVFDKMVTIKAVKEATGTHKNDYIPCGESEITKILCNAFGGNSYTTLLCCIKPGNIYKEDTNQTLQIANSAKLIKNEPLYNQNLSETLTKLLDV